MSGPTFVREPLRHRSGFISDPSMYYEVLEPLEHTGKPHVLMVTGGTQTGAAYLSTPDGRPGWAHVFVAQGYPVILTDWPGVGRSGDLPPERITGELVVRGLAKVLEQAGAPAVLMTHSMSGAFGWKLLELRPELIAKLVAVAPAPPGNMGKELGTLVSESGSVKVVAMASGTSAVDLNSVVRMDIDFARKKKIGTGSRFPMENFDAHFGSLQGVGGRLMYERTNIGGAQLRIDDFAGLQGKRILVVTGTDDTDHPKALDGEIVHWLNAHGARAEYCYLGDIGIAGNSHVMMLENNSDEIALRIIGWLQDSTN